MSQSVLQRILDRTRSDVLRRRIAKPLAQLRAELAGLPPRKATHQEFGPLGRALAGPGLSLIAEVKPRSPSQGELLRRNDVPGVVDLYSERAQAISVLVDQPFFGGGLELLADVRQRSTLPLLAKGFFLDPYQLLEARIAGADGVLLMLSAVGGPLLVELLQQSHELGMDVLLEAHSDEETRRAVQVGASIVGINCRDLHSLEIHPRVHRQCAKIVPKDRILVCESGISSARDISGLPKNANAILVGTALLKGGQISQKLDLLGW